MVEHDYDSLEPPTDEPREEWHYSHRRAWILEHQVLAKGSLDAVNWSELAEMFSKSKSTLHKDKRRLAEYLAADVNEEEVRARGRAIFETVLRDALADYRDPDNTKMTAERLLNVYRTWIKTLREFGQLPPAADDPRFEDDEDEDDLPDRIEVGLSAVEATEFDPDALAELPEQDRPEEVEAGEDAAETVEAETVEEGTHE